MVKAGLCLLMGKTAFPENHFVRAIAEDPDRKGLIYAGTEYGMYVSFNDGKQWQSLQLNLPHVPITDLEVHQKDLVLSTQGRAFWILDDLSVLHELEPEIAEKEIHFFKPRAAYRTNISGYNPVFYTFLKEDPKDSYKLEILNSEDEVVRTYEKGSKNRLNRIKLKKGANTLKWGFALFWAYFSKKSGCHGHTKSIAWALRSSRDI